MTMAIDWTGITDPQQKNEEGKQEHPRADPALVRLTDPLLRDIGLTRAEMLGPEESFRHEWARHRALWSL